MKNKIIPLLFVSASLLIGSAADTSIQIDVTKTKTPISKYIYGQFIEHLGKCIYGGIWAEMLEDRKFYYPITDEFNPFGLSSDPYWKAGSFRYLQASPWQVVGPPKTIAMDSVNIYVGDHTPSVIVSGGKDFYGIRQDNLSFQKGKKYQGRIVLAGDQAGDTIFVRMKLNESKTLTQPVKLLTKDFKTYEFSFKSTVSTHQASIEIVSRGTGKFWIGAVSLMPTENVNGWRKDVISVLKELNSPVYRWPGGNFVSGYNWQDGIGEQDKRPPRKNPAWKGVEPNDVGIHEYMNLMEILGAEAFIAVNTGLGTLEEVVKEVEYCNGPIDSPMGKLRAQNGHSTPFDVKWWAVGNEMYGSWQLGHMPLENYVKKHNDIATAMWNVDPSIQLIGVGSMGQWSETMLRECADKMNLISEHIYCQEKKNITEHTLQLSQDIARKAEAHRKYRAEIPGLKNKNLRVAMDEWNYWYGDYIYGELGVRYFHKDALGVAIGLHEFFRNSDIYFMANYAQTVNVIGCIKTTPTSVGFATTGLPLKLYRQHFGTIPLELPDSNGDLDLAVALTEDRKYITIAIVNPTNQKEQVTFDFGPLSVKNKADLWVIMHPNPDTYNEPGKEPNVKIQEKKISMKPKTLNLPVYSISLIKIQIN
ncbi:MAG: alpha-N-arabinofuranosidase [Candidatus Marinimicrobia bacterium]|nr:alpha-N-arabinofuranosidase [Candidatus Neomarinimicrobiota bacterium]